MTGKNKKVQVIKIGTSSIITEKNMYKVNRAVLKGYAYDIYKMRQEGLHSVLVISGAIKLGMGVCGVTKMPAPNNVIELQRYSKVGQIVILNEYTIAFDGYYVTSQLLVTDKELHDKENEKTIEKGIKDNIQQDIITLINNNDGTDTNGLVLTDYKGHFKFRENDMISAEVAIHSNAYKLIMVTNSKIPGTVGGYETKTKAIKRAEKNGIEVIVGEYHRGLYNICNNNK